MSLRTNKQLYPKIARKANATGTPESEELKLINQFTIREHSADEVYARTMVIAHNGIDRDREVIDDKLIEALADSLAGKGLFIKHPSGWDGDSGPGEGRFYHAEAKRMSLDAAREVLREPNLKFLEGTEEAVLLEASFYTTIENREKLIADIDAGVAGDVSLGFSYAERNPVTDGEESVIATRLMAPGVAYEGSLVWLGAQPGARITKHADRQTNEEDAAMDDKTKQQKISDLEAQLKTANDSLQLANTKAAQFDALKALIPEQFNLDDENSTKEMVEAITVGLEARSSMVDEAVKAERLLNLIDDTDEAEAEAKKSYEQMPFSQLKKYHEKNVALAKKDGKGGQLTTGDANTTGSGAESSEKDMQNDPASPFGNKAVTG